MNINKENHRIKSRILKPIIVAICLISLQGCAALAVGAVTMAQDTKKENEQAILTKEMTEEFNHKFDRSKGAIACRISSKEVVLGSHAYISSMARFYVDGGYMVYNQNGVITTTHKQTAVIAPLKSMLKGKIYRSETGLSMGFNDDNRLVAFYYYDADSCKDLYIDGRGGLSDYVPVLMSDIQQQTNTQSAYTQ